MTYLEKGDFANAEKALLEVGAASVSANREVFYNLGEVKFAKGETDEAVKDYQRAVDMDAELGQAALQARSRASCRRPTPPARSR